MQVVILAGGFGSRISEESGIRPKPMIEIGGRPILWHIMKIYSAHGINDFIICLGYKGYMIKEYFSNYWLQMSDVTFDFKNETTNVHQNNTEPWKITLVDTGEKSMTGGRLKRVRPYLENGTFCLTYGDGVSDIDITKLIAFHRKEGVLGTLTAVKPPGRFGAFNLSKENNRIASFKEKPQGDGAWINGGFFVLEPGVMDYIDGDATVWEHDPIEKLSHNGEMAAFRHYGFWQSMDSLRDKMVLEELWTNGKRPWKIW